MIRFTPYPGERPEEMVAKRVTTFVVD